jgi:hypothetical protein
MTMHRLSTARDWQLFAGIPAAMFAAGCTIDVQQPAIQHPATEAQTVQVCPADYLLTTPVAAQCCYASSITNDNDGFTMFYNAATNEIVTRTRNPFGFGCRASDGTGACDGADCFYGPAGFSRASFSTPPGTDAEPFWTIFAATTGASTTCQVAGPAAIPYDPTFIDLSGINAPGQGCPGSDSSAFAWDY